MSDESLQTVIAEELAKATTRIKELAKLQGKKDVHVITQIYDPKTGDYLGKFDVIINEIVGENP